jgi:hypothetical protein
MEKRSRTIFLCDYITELKRLPRTANRYSGWPLLQAVAAIYDIFLVEQCHTVLDSATDTDQAQVNIFKLSFQPK